MAVSEEIQFAHDQKCNSHCDLLHLQRKQQVDIRVPAPMEAIWIEAHFLEFALMEPTLPEIYFSVIMSAKCDNDDEDDVNEM